MFAVDSKGEPFREEFCVLDIQGVQASSNYLINRFRNIEHEYYINDWYSIELQNNGGLAIFRANFSGTGGQFVLKFVLDNPEYAPSHLTLARPLT